MKSKLLLSTFDGSLGEIKIIPECLDTIIQFKILYYDENDKEVQAEIIFEKVIKKISLLSTANYGRHLSYSC